jgi:hypothetical protein
MIASEDPALPSTRRDGIPIELERTVLRCLEKDPEGRATLVELARTLARYAPDRARASLERIEATTGTTEPRPRAPTYADRMRSESVSSPTRTRMGDRMGDAASPSDRGGRTMSSWGRDPRGKRGGSGIVVLLVVASGLAAVAVYTGRIGVMKLRGDIAGATSAVSSAANAVSSAAGAVGSAVDTMSSAVSSVSSAVASSLPPLPPIPGIDEPAASASAAPSASGSASADPDQGDPSDEDEPAASGKPGATPAPQGGGQGQGHPAAQKAHPKPTHHGKTHKHHS